MGVGDRRGVVIAKTLETICLSPFELTKLSAQISVLNADRAPQSILLEPNNSQLSTEVTRTKEHGKWQTESHIVEYRGITMVFLTSMLLRNLRHLKNSRYLKNRRH